MARAKKQDASWPDFDLMARAGAALGRGVDPIEVFEYCGKWAFDPAAEKLAEIYRRYAARQKARGFVMWRKSGSSQRFPRGLSLPPLRWRVHLKPLRF